MTISFRNQRCFQLTLISLSDVFMMNSVVGSHFRQNFVKVARSYIVLWMLTCYSQVTNQNIDDCVGNLTNVWIEISLYSHRWRIDASRRPNIVGQWTSMKTSLSNSCLKIPCVIKVENPMNNKSWKSHVSVLPELALDFLLLLLSTFSLVCVCTVSIWAFTCLLFSIYRV